MDTLLCPDCYSSIDFFSQPIQIKLEDNYLDQLFALARYEGVTQKLIHALKYEGVYEVGIVLGRLLYYCFVIPDCDYITAVPIHYKRMRERGFNQANIIAEELSKNIEKPFIEFLDRPKHSEHQASITDREKRLDHLKNHFKINDPAVKKFPLQNKSILLIDDVCTTGSTLNECARVLKAHGAQTVIGLTIAHGS